MSKGLKDNCIMFVHTRLAMYDPTQIIGKSLYFLLVILPVYATWMSVLPSVFCPMRIPCGHLSCDLMLCFPRSVACPESLLPSDLKFNCFFPG